MKKTLVSFAAIWLAVFLQYSATSAAPPSSGVPTGTYAVLPAESGVAILVRSTFHDVDVRAKISKGHLVWPAAGSGSARLRLEFSPLRMESGDDTRDQEMREDVLEHKKFPLIIFEADEIVPAKAGDGDANFRVAGTLSLHGFKKRLTIPVRATAQGDRLTAEGKINIRLSDYKLVVPAPIFFLKTEDVLVLTARFVLKRVKE